MSAKAMIASYMPWLLSAITIYMTVLAGNKSRNAWLVGIANQALWLVWIISPQAQSAHFPEHTKTLPLRGLSMADSNSNYAQSLYQSLLGRDGRPDEVAYWQQRLDEGTPQHRVQAEFNSTPEGSVNQIYRDLLGRTADPQGLAHYMEILPEIGYMGMRSDIQRQPEYQNRQLDDWDVYRENARQATAGINAMPYTYSDYTLQSMGGPTGGMNAVYPGGTQGQGLMGGLSGLLDFSKEAQAPQLPQVEQPATPASAAPDPNQVKQPAQALDPSQMTPEEQNRLRRRDR